MRRMTSRLGGGRLHEAVLESVRQCHVTSRLSCSRLHEAVLEPVRQRHVTSRLGGGGLHEAVLEPVRERELVDASQRLDELVDAGVAAEDAPLL